MKGLKLWEVLKAIDEGKDIQYYDDDRKDWREPVEYSLENFSISIECGIIYRIKPEAEVREYYSRGSLSGFSINHEPNLDTHKITIEFEDGEPICSSIKMKKI